MVIKWLLGFVYDHFLNKNVYARGHKIFPLVLEVTKICHSFASSLHTCHIFMTSQTRGTMLYPTGITYQYPESLKCYVQSTLGNSGVHWNTLDSGGPKALCSSVYHAQLGNIKKTYQDEKVENNK